MKRFLKFIFRIRKLQKNRFIIAQLFYFDNCARKMKSGDGVLSNLIDSGGDEGRTSTEIASRLYISKTTVKFHRDNLMDKLDVRNVAGLTRQAIRLKVLQI